MTKILATIGEVSSDIKSLKKIYKHTNFFRLNLSHNKLKWHSKVSKIIKKNFKNSIILVDLPGVKPRTCNELNIKILKNQIIRFYFKKKKFGDDIFSIGVSNIIPKAKKKYFTVSDGKNKFKFIKQTSNEIIGISEDSFILFPRQGLNIPFSSYDNKLQEQKYFNTLKKLHQIKFDAVGLSFIQDNKIINKIKKLYPKINLISKIENYLGIKNLIDIVKSSDGIMIDRGDLQAELGELNLFDNVRKIISVSHKFGKPLIMATENLGGMMLGTMPTKNDLISIGYSIQMNVDTIMLSEETAVNKNFFKIIKTLSDILQKEKKKRTSKKFELNDSIIWESLAKLQYCKIVLFTKKGFAIDKIRTINPDLDLFIFTDNKKIFNQSKIRKYCKSVLIPKFNNKNLEMFTYKYIKKYSKSIFSKTENSVLLRVSFPTGGMRANTLTILNKKSFS